MKVNTVIIDIGYYNSLLESKIKYDESHNKHIVSYDKDGKEERLPFNEQGLETLLKNLNELSDENKNLKDEIESLNRMHKDIKNNMKTTTVKGEETEGTKS